MTTCTNISLDCHEFFERLLRKSAPARQENVLLAGFDKTLTSVRYESLKA